MMMFKDYPDVVTVEHLQEMLGICRKNRVSAGQAE